ncbi:MAG TPA: AAA family ATPase [Ktedonobacteraceae bacterium]
MVQNLVKAPLVAQQVTWKYWGTSEHALDKEFYAALQQFVANAVRERLLSGSTHIWIGREIQVEIGLSRLRARATMLSPLNANIVTEQTQFIAQYQERPQDERQDISTFISEIIRYPAERYEGLYNSLVGIDQIKADLLLKLEVLLRPELIEHWVQRHYAAEPPYNLMLALYDRYPLIVLEGEVGAGKTALARSIGQILTPKVGAVALLVINAQVRGGGHVGELTQNIARSFVEAERYQEQEGSAVIILLDEADALAQTRGTQQTHHEDDAGVNTLIQCIDRLRGRPIAVLFSTNLLQTLDAAILRRAAAAFHFDRPDFSQRILLFRHLLQTFPISDEDFQSMAVATRPRERDPGNKSKHIDRYTYSDISQRIIPRSIEKVINEGRAINVQDILTSCEQIRPTPDNNVHITLQNAREYARFFE